MAVTEANTNRQILESTGLSAAACAQHGCFIPHSIVDFQKGERLVPISLINRYLIFMTHHTRQMNMDYVLSTSLGRLGGIKHILILYDIMCQY